MKSGTKGMQYFETCVPTYTRNNSAFGVHVHDIKPGGAVIIKRNRFVRNGVMGRRMGATWGKKPGRGTVEFVENEGCQLMIISVS